MARGKRRAASISGQREARAIAANLGRDLRSTRRRRRLTQAALGALVDRGQSEISYMERGLGARTSLETWVAIGVALDRPIGIGFSREVIEPLRDAGHLAAQELVLRTARSAGWRGSFEARFAERHTGSTGLSADLVLERPGIVVLVEIWNRVDDLGAAVRSTDRKLVLAPAGSRSVWLIVDTIANRAIVRRFPEIFRSRFPASSAAWIDALMSAATPPPQAGIGWVDVRAGRLRPTRFSQRTPQLARR